MYVGDRVVLKMRGKLVLQEMQEMHRRHQDTGQTWTSRASSTNSSVAIFAVCASGMCVDDRTGFLKGRRWQNFFF